MKVTEPRHSPHPTSDAPTLRDAIAQLDDAAITPGHIPTAATALDTLLAALAQHDTALLEEIRRSEPRLGHRVVALQHTTSRLTGQARSLRSALRHPSLDPAILRTRLVDLARDLRRHQSTESDIIFEAINTDLGAGD